MSELIKRLERVIAAGVPDKNGQHPISAEVVLDVVKQLQTAELGTDCISRQAAIDVLNSFDVLDGHTDKEEIKERIERLPPAQPEIVRCKECINRHLGHGFCPMVHVSIDGKHEFYELNQDDDFCSFAERRTETE